MTRMVQCVKLDKEAPGLERPTYPGDLGKRIYLNISQEAWQSWVAHQTMLINEYRLTPVDPKARKFLEEEMEKFLFTDQASAIDNFVPPGLKIPVSAVRFCPWPPLHRPIALARGAVACTKPSTWINMSLHLCVSGMAFAACLCSGRN